MDLALVVALALMMMVSFSHGTELTFDMNPSEEQCFMEDIKGGVSATLEYQVVYGGRLDIDVKIIHNNEVLHQERKSQAGSHHFTAGETGEYQFCFSNEFSTVAHKTVYFDVIVGEEEPLFEEDNAHHKALTQIETSLVSMHDSLKKVVDYQTHHRMRESTHRKTAEYMNNRVQLVSAGEAILLVAISLFQVLYLRSLFSEPRM
eukprot:m.10922 g.10922  ORF g.10922 m.10922 type:complete len:204 (+) comp7519_c0_seq1:46-657(+)